MFVGRLTSEIQSSPLPQKGAWAEKCTVVSSGLRQENNLREDVNPATRQRADEGLCLV
jgi:hypothetical protein